jgi:hypothetical protein
MTFVLDTTSRKIILDPTTDGGDLQFTASWADATATSLIEGASHGVGNASSETDVVGSPAASTRRIIKSITIHNANGSNLSREFILVYEDGANERIIARGTLAAGATWYSDDAGVNTVNDGDKGDITVSGAGGVWTIDNDAVTTAKVADAAITPAKLSSVAQVLAFKNRLINGSFAIDQRNAGATTSIADDVYCFDRWYILSQTNTVQVVRQIDTANGIPTNIRITQNQASAQRCGIAQIIESINCRDLRGQSVVLRFDLRCSASQAIRYAIIEWTGTADSVTSDVVSSWTNGTFTTGQFFNTTSLTLVGTGSTTPSANTWTTATALTGTVSASANNLIVFIWSEGTLAQNATLDLAKVQLERGPTATEFEVLPFSVTFKQCRRYAWQLTGGSLVTNLPLGVGSTSTTVQTTLNFGFAMRATPTFSALITGSAATLRDFAAAAFDITDVIFEYGTPMGGSIKSTITVGTMTVYRPYAFFYGNSNQYLRFEAEL